MATPDLRLGGNYLWQRWRLRSRPCQVTCTSHRISLATVGAKERGDKKTKMVLAASMVWFGSRWASNWIAAAKKADRIARSRSSIGAVPMQFHMSQQRSRRMQMARILQAYRPCRMIHTRWNLLYTRPAKRA